MKPLGSNFTTTINSCDGTLLMRRDAPEAVSAHLPSDKIKKIKEAVYFKCEREDKTYPARQLRVHHLNPAMRGGANTERNLVVLCTRHHLAATAGVRRGEKAALRAIVGKRTLTVRRELKKLLGVKSRRRGTGKVALVCGMEQYTRGFVCDVDTPVDTRKRTTR